MAVMNVTYFFLSTSSSSLTQTNGPDEGSQLEAGLLSFIGDYLRNPH